MTDKNINKENGVIGKWFTLVNRKKSKYKLENFLTLFNEDDYWIYKYTKRQKLVGPEWKDFKYCGYIFFNKDLYDKDHINKWIDFFPKNFGLMYLIKPLPPLSIMEKIRIIQ